MKAKLMMKVNDANEMHGEIVQVECGGIVIAAELVDCDVEYFNKDEEVDVDIKFFCHELYGVYKNKEEYYKNNKDMDAESYIPVGTLSKEDENEPSALNFINLVVDEIVNNFQYYVPEELLLLYGKVCDAKLDIIISYSNLEEKDSVEPWNVISALYWAELSPLD